MFAHLTTNRARGRLTLFIEANVLTTMPDHSEFLCSVRQKQNDICSHQMHSVGSKHAKNSFTTLIAIVLSQVRDPLTTSDDKEIGREKQ